MLDKLHKKMCEDKCGLAFDELKAFVKDMASIEGSTKDITHEQMQELKEVCKFLADQINCKIDNID